MNSGTLLWLVGLTLPMLAVVLNGGHVPALADITARIPLLTAAVAVCLGGPWWTGRRWMKRAPWAFAAVGLATAITFLIPYALIASGEKITIGLGVAAGMAALLFAVQKVSFTVEGERLSLVTLAALALVATWFVFDSGSAGLATHFAALAAAAFAGGVLPRGNHETSQTYSRAVVTWTAVFAAMLLAAVLFGGLGLVPALALALLPVSTLAAFGSAHRRVAVITGIALLAVGASACDGMFPVGKGYYSDHVEQGEVRFRLGADALNLLGEENPVTLRIRVFAVTDDQLGDQEDVDHSFAISKDVDTYSLTDVRLGWKEFQVALLNDHAEVIGDGKVRFLVKPGRQTLDTPLEIKVRPVERRRRDVAISLFARIAVPDQPTKLTYMDVRPVIDASCAKGGCHVAAPGAVTAGGLDLATFPFTSTNHPWTQDQIVNEMVLAMRDLQYTMPPPTTAPPLPAAQIALFDQWRTDGLLKVPSADGTSELAHKIRIEWTVQGTSEKGEVTLERATDGDVPFPGKLLQLPITMKCDFRFVVVAADGKDVATITMVDWVVPEGGAIEKILDIPYSAPVIDIPIVITR